MIKTHPKSKFTLRSLEDIRNHRDVLLQVQDTGSKFNENGLAVYLCEEVSLWEYTTEATLGNAVKEIEKLNEENRKLHRRIERLEKENRRLERYLTMKKEQPKGQTP